MWPVPGSPEHEADQGTWATLGPGDHRGDGPAGGLRAVRILLYLLLLRSEVSATCRWFTNELWVIQKDPLL